MTIRGLVDTETGNLKPYAPGINPNLLINSNGKNMINQREASVVVAQGAYGFDRWTAHGVGFTTATFSQTQTGARITATTKGSAPNILMRQHLGNRVEYRGKTLTASARVRRLGAETGTTLQLYNGVSWALASVPNDENWYNVKVTTVVPESSNLILFRINTDIDNDGDYVEFEWVKLEEGDHATPYVIPDPALELKRCYRYFQAYGGETGGGLYQGFTDMYNRTTNGTYGNFDFKAPMRTIPTVTVSSPSHFCAEDKTATNALSALSLGSVTRTNAWAVGTTVGNPLVVGEKCLLESNNTTAARIYLDADT